MKIMFYISSLGKGGAQRVLSVICDKLLEKNEIFILVNTKSNISYPFSEKIKIIELDKKRNKNPLFRNLKRVKQVKVWIKKIMPDVIISFLPVPSFISLYAKRKMNIPCIVTDRNDPNQEYKSMISQCLMKWLYPQADGFIFQTKEQQQYFCKEIQEKSTIIFNPIKEEFLLEDEIPYKEKENVIISVGRLVRQKNQKMLINAFSNVLKKYPNYKLKIFGEGILRQELQKQIEELGIQDKAFLCGISDNIKKELEKARIFVLPSDYEGMPNVLIEAMGTGLPVISTDCPCGGPKELIDNFNNGILIPINDEDELTKGLTGLIENQELAQRLGENAKKIKETLHPNHIVKQWEEYIIEVVKKNKE